MSLQKHVQASGAIASLGRRTRSENYLQASFTDDSKLTRIRMLSYDRCVHCLNMVTHAVAMFVTKVDTGSIKP